MSFNPDDFFEEITVKDVAEQFAQLKEFDYTIESLNEKLVELNHEIVSTEYEEKKFADIERYYDLVVDRIV
jgi:hypothetical protein